MNLFEQDADGDMRHKRANGEIAQSDLLSLIPASIAIESMSDSGYKDTTYAIAELVDNAVEAGADHVEMICFESLDDVKQRSRWHIDRIAVVDNGRGMDRDELAGALQFGSGTRRDRRGMGRFGFGLPNASISQARKVEVWSWQNGPANALYMCLDVDEIVGGRSEHLQRPKHMAVPEDIRSVASSIGDTGTVVLWSKIDPERMTWRTATATIRNVTYVLGRIYRKFLDGTAEVNGASSAATPLELEMVTVREGKEQTRQRTRPNDPLYLTTGSSSPYKDGREAMFEKLEIGMEEEIEFNGRKGRVRSTYSLAKRDTLVDGNRGDTIYGREAAKNMGLSIVRAGRELLLDPTWCKVSDTRERWWGAEIEFDPQLDELFGVTNNKQAANAMNGLVNVPWEDFAEDDEEYQAMIRRLKADGDRNGWLLELRERIVKNLQVLHDKVVEQGSQRRTNKKRQSGTTSTKPDPENERLNEEWRKREQRHTTESLSKPLDEESLTKNLEEEGYSAEEAKEVLARIKNGELRVMFAEEYMRPYPELLFDVLAQGPLTRITVNSAHPAHTLVFGSLDPDNENVENLSNAELVGRLKEASAALQMLIGSWARYEIEQPVNRQGNARSARTDWGRVAYDFLKSGNQE